MICLQTHTHTHTDLYLPPHAQKHTRACVRAPRHGSCILLFLSLSVLSLIWFPLGKTSLAWWDLIWPACHSYFSFFPPPPYLDCLVNLPADGLVGCWQAGYCGWQAEKLPGWMMSDSRWMNDWRQGSSRLRLMKSFFYLENQGENSFQPWCPWSNCDPTSSQFSSRFTASKHSSSPLISYLSVLYRIFQLLLP